jgi:hypothetical protein
MTTDTIVTGRMTAPTPRAAPASLPGGGAHLPSVSALVECRSEGLARRRITDPQRPARRSGQGAFSWLDRADNPPWTIAGAWPD